VSRSDWIDLADSISFAVKLAPVIDFHECYPYKMDSTMAVDAGATRALVSDKQNQTVTVGGKDPYTTSDATFPKKTSRV
jgi:hypothetical protein